MKLIKLTCPSCGARMEVNASMETFTCNYCGETSLLDDEAINIKIKGNITNTDYDNNLANLKKSLKYKSTYDFLEEAQVFIRKYPKSMEGTYLFLTTLFEKYDICWNYTQKDIGFKEVEFIYKNFLKSDYTPSRIKEVKDKYEKIMKASNQIEDNQKKANKRYNDEMNCRNLIKGRIQINIVLVISYPFIVGILWLFISVLAMAIDEDVFTLLYLLFTLAIIVGYFVILVIEISDIIYLSSLKKKKYETIINDPKFQKMFKGKI